MAADRDAQVDPHSNEIRYALGLVGQTLAGARPQTVRIASHSNELVKATIRHIGCDGYTLFVESPELQHEIEAALGLAVEVRSMTRIADAAVFPFSLEDGLAPAGEPLIVAACYNALSYKSLLRARHLRGTAQRKMAALSREYVVDPVAGLFSPVFIALIGLARVLARVDPAAHLRVEDVAMRRLIEFGRMWRLSYVVVVSGRRAD